MQNIGDANAVREPPQPVVQVNSAINTTNAVHSNVYNNLNDYPLPGVETIPGLKSPVYHGGTLLSKSTLASEAHQIRNTLPQKYQRIAKPVPMMRVEYDVVVVGSGYGGAVAASRMARAGKTVCLLELGKERWPGEFPVDLVQATKQVHMSGKILEDDSEDVLVETGDPTGLYHLIVGDGQNAFVGNGLGGTSLLNANVFLKTDHRTLAQNVFPPEIRADPACLDPYYARAEQVLQPQPYPENYPKLDKLKVLEEQAKLLGKEYHERFYRVPQTTTFQDGLNSMGVKQSHSTLSGQDCTGVNDGSKNSTLMNYLPDAWNRGAEMFCECEVRHIKQNKQGKNKWTVFFAWHGDKRADFKDSIHSDLMWVQAKEFVFLGAGTLGTTQILLRSRERGLKQSPSLGMNMSGNGDILAFGFNTNKIVNAIGTTDAGYLAKSPVGPTINGIIDMRDEQVAPNVLDGYVIEEGAVPEALSHLLGTMLKVIPDEIHPTGLSPLDYLGKLASQIETKVLGPYSPDSSINRTMIYLVMSHDDNQATLTLEKDKPYLRFEGVARSQNVKYINNVLAKATNLIGGTFVQNPFFAKEFGQKEITVHPVGGANMSSDGTGSAGVTDHFGQVFKGLGCEVYDGLVVVDGAVIPAALGVNPFATITAFAERSVEGVAAAKGYTIDYEDKNGAIDWACPKVKWPMTEDMQIAEKDIANSPMTGGARFTEIMDGYMYIGDDIDDYESAANAAKEIGSMGKFYLSVDAWDIDSLKYKENHAAMLTGTFTAAALSKDPFMILRGDFQLFSEDSRSPDTKNFVYDFDMISTSGEIVHFYGYKVVDPSIAFHANRAWKATTTLYVTLSRPDKSILGRGILRISWKNFADELLTFSGIGESSLIRTSSAAGFLSFFTERLAGSFLAPLNMSHYPEPMTTKGYYAKQPPTTSVTLTASDGIKTTMQVWVPQQGSQKKPILLVPGASVDHQIFALPTVPFNFVDFLLEKGYTVYCVTHRVGKTPVAKGNWTTYDARLDIAAATKFILKAEKVEKIYAVVHCAGSVAMSMGLLDGTIKGIGGLTASNVFMGPMFAKVNIWKSSIVPSMATTYKKLIGPWYECVDDKRDTVFQKILNEALHLYPVGEMKEVCNSVVCHRSELVFGKLWTHGGLNEATHSELDNFLGGISMDCLDHLMHMGKNGIVVDNEMKNLLTPKNLERLKGIPILFIHGEDNTVYTPECTMKDYDALRKQFGGANYERVQYPGKGHLDCWMGKASFADVYPRVEQHAKKIIPTFTK